MIVVICVGYGYYRQQSERNRQRQYDRLAQVYAEISVIAELHRNEPQLFYPARDSLYRLHGFSPESVAVLKNSLMNREEDWSYIWQVVKHKTDSLTEYYRAHPIEHSMPDSLDSVKDSVYSHR